MGATKAPVIKTGAVYTRIASRPTAYRSGFGDFAGLDAARAHAQPLGRAVDHRLHRLQIHVPGTARHVVRVRDVVAEARPLAADIACLSHDEIPSSSTNLQYIETRRFAPNARRSRTRFW